jgi:hypothetical protein
MPDTTVDTVAKKKSSRKPSETPDPTDKARKPLIVQLRGSEEFGAWVEQGADFDRSTVSVPCREGVDSLPQERGILHAAAQTLGATFGLLHAVR